MAVNTRVIRRRIKSVTNTKKITKAMEMVAASKMRKAVGSVLSTRPYATLAWEMVGEISRLTDVATHPLLGKPTKSRNATLLILITSDRGLCGGFNAQMLKETFKFLRAEGGKEIDVITIGKKGGDAIRRVKKNVIASFADLTNNPRAKDVLPVARLAMDEFVAGKYESVFLAYTDYVSAIKQIPRVRQLLPIIKDEDAERSPSEALAKDGGYGFMFEPNPKEILEVMLPRLVETQVFQALLESAASEHSARMLAMRNASDAAGEMIDDLTFTFNQARQAAITREISEISAGKAVIEG
jgi:F-type H+-transporting ATPase subunit gamma